MRLNDRDIIEAMQKGDIKISPEPNESSVSEISVDLKLGNEFRVFQSYNVPCIDLGNSKEDMIETLLQVMSEEIYIPDGEIFVLQPNEFAIAVTHESVTLGSDIVGWIEGKRAHACLGLVVNSSSHKVDSSWNGRIILELYNSGKIPLALRPSMTIASMSFEKLNSSVIRKYDPLISEKYKELHGDIISKIILD